MDNNKDIDVRLIEAVGKNECLYNSLCAQYKEFEYKERIWAKIGESTGKTVSECKKKWKYLRDGYRRSQNKASTYGFYKPYKYSSYMKFLDTLSVHRVSKPILPRTLDVVASRGLSSTEEFQHGITKNQTCDFYHSLDVSQKIERATKDKTKAQNTQKIPIALKEEDKADTQCWKERLIEEVRSHECIYNVQSEKYKDFEYKKQLWHRIGKILGLKGKEASRKWKNLRDAYRKYKRKAKVEGFVKYKYATSLKFLEDHISVEPSTSLNLSEAEVSTELSSDDEFQYKAPKMEMEADILNSFEDIHDSWDESTCDLLTQDSKPNQLVVQIEETGNSMPKDLGAKLYSECSDEDRPALQQELLARLIAEVRKHECIYNKKLNEYKNFPYKKRVWYKIGKRIGLSANEAKGKWKNLRDGYRKYKLKSLTEGFAGSHKYADSLKFLDEFIDLLKTTKREKKLHAACEISTELSSESDFYSNQDLLTSQSARVSIDSNPVQSAKEAASTIAITSHLFQYLFNKIQEANLTEEQQTSIEYAVSSVVHSKLAEYSKNKTQRAGFF